MEDMRWLSFKPTKKVMYYINKSEAIYNIYNRTELFYLGFSVFLEKYSPSEFTKKEALEFGMTDIDYESLDIKNIPSSMKFSLNSDQFKYMDELSALRSNGLHGHTIAVIMFKSLVDKHEEIKKLEVRESDTEIVINRNKLVEAISNLYSSEGNESIKRVIKSIVFSNEI